MSDAPAIKKLVAHHAIAPADVDLWDRTNVNGGAVALGHPYGMSGIRYLGSTLMELARRDKHRAIVGVCTAGGMATAAFLER
jgi:acetyl-CoA C-acetyltransferase